MKIILRLLIFLALSSLFHDTYSQKRNRDGIPDTVAVRKGSRVTYHNMSFMPENDTVIIVPDTVYFKVKLDAYLKSEVFYEKMEMRSTKSKFHKSIYDMTFAKNRTRRDTVVTMKSETLYLEYEGMTIRNIRIKRLEVFGPSLEDTIMQASRKIGKILNSIHITSREFVIKHNLRIKSGDRVNPLIFSENERLLRQLPFIEDAILILTPINVESDSVDVLVITKDVWSISMVPIILSASSYRFRLFDANFLGMGHRFSNEIEVNTNNSPAARYKQFIYQSENIGGSFIHGLVEVVNYPDEQTYNIRFDRPFIPPLITVGGGVGYKKTDRLINIYTYGEDTTVTKGHYVFDVYHGWAGKTFPTKLFETENENKSYLTLSGKYAKYIYVQHQDFEDDTKYKFENRDIILGSVSLSKNNYMLTKLLYSFGTTEDIPYGYNLTLTIGEKFGEYSNLFYSGIRFSYGQFTKNENFLYGGIEYGGYIYNWSLREGLLGLKGTYVSRLKPFLGGNLRNYIEMGYLNGVGRFSSDLVYLDDKSGYRGVGQNTELTGDQRLNINLESVLFTPWYFLGFRFAGFAYVDNGIITFNNKIFDMSHYYMGLGFGVRIRNENLIFQTFQIDFSFYPIAPQGVDPVKFSIRSVGSIHPYNFNPTAPSQVIFR